MTKLIYLAGSRIGLDDWGEMPWREFVQEEYPLVIDGTERSVKPSKDRDTLARISKENLSARLESERIKREISTAAAVIGFLDWSWGRPLSGYHLDWELELAKEAGKFVGLVDKRGECERENTYWLERVDFYHEKLYPVVVKTLLAIGVTPKPDELRISGI